MRDAIVSRTAGAGRVRPLAGLAAVTLAAVALGSGGVSRGSAAAVALPRTPTPVPAIVGTPSVVTGAATAVQGIGASVSGSVNPAGGSANASIVLGTDPALRSGRRYVGVPGAFTGTDPVPVTQRLAGLALGTRYYYKLLASNECGTAYGAIKSFKTWTIKLSVKIKISENGSPRPRDRVYIQASNGGGLHLSGTATITGTRFIDNRSVGVEEMISRLGTVRVRDGRAAFVLPRHHPRLRVGVRFVGYGDTGSTRANSRIVPGS